ncbi:hypothetical protein [Halorientalis pallida]|uniref:Uncharacterized protein n=1 Tax=Halorientalis pallida TaxID=2479928 RepID=A0A498L5P0_9EURY|nr:hypothetical protein [Halorientalis pallida]RXK51592.1 hypothetical protein EAF64_02885 [Halorientalis pallida]
MASSSPSSNERRLFPPVSDLRPALAQYGTGLKAGVTGLAFWSAIVLPFLYLPLLAYGLRSSSIVGAFVGLLALNVVAAVIGHRYHD